jgi:hypothetical protein
MNKILTMAELERKSAPDLHRLFAQASSKLVMTERFSRNRQNLLATLENINRARDRLWLRTGGT